MHPKHHHHKPKASSSVALNLLPGWLSAPSYNSTCRPGPCNCWSSQLKKEVGLTCHSLEAHSLKKVCNAFVTCLGFKHIGVLQIHEKRIASVLWAGFKFHRPALFFCACQPCLSQALYFFHVRRLKSMWETLLCSHVKAPAYIVAGFILFCLQFAYSKTLHFKWSGLVKVAPCLGLKGSVLPAEAFLTTKNELEWWTLEGCLGGPVSAYGPVKYLRAQ